MPRLDNLRWRWVLAASALCILYLVPRLSNLDALVTTDEPIWLGRSANFFSALWHGRLEDTFQHAHPGVPTMWAGMVGYWFAFPGYVSEYTDNFPLTFEIHQRIRAAGLHELDVLIAARTSKIALQAVLFLVAMFFCMRRFGGMVALLTGSIIALEPFLVGNDQLLHVDGLFAISSFAAIMALADAFVVGRSRMLPWIIAGALAAVSWLTRSTGIVIVAVMGIWLLWITIRDSLNEHQPLRGRVRAFVRPALAWGGAALATTLLLWPALWAAPQPTLGFMLEWATDAAASGHELPIFFAGAIHHGDPGLLFYPVTLLWRLTPLTLSGLLLFTILLVFGRLRLRQFPEGTLRSIGIASTFAVLYLIGMSLGGKKFDRYVLPLYPILDLFAAIGFAGVTFLIVDTIRSHRRVIMATAVVIIVLLQGSSWLHARPYPLAYFNPLPGGTAEAVNEVQVGWGESTREAAEFILATSDREDPTVRMSGSRGPLLYFLPEPVVVSPYPFETVADWETTDYYVSSIQHWQRDLYNDVIGYLEEFDPAHVVTVDGVPYTQVYDLDAIPPPPYLPESDGCYHEFGSALRLIQVTSDRDQVTLWFRTISRTPPPAVEVSAQFHPPSETQEMDSIQETHVNFPVPQQRGIVGGAALDVSLPDGEALESYSAEITVRDSETGEVLPVRTQVDMESQEAALVSLNCGDAAEPD